MNWRVLVMVAMGGACGAPTTPVAKPQPAVTHAPEPEAAHEVDPYAARSRAFTGEGVELFEQKSYAAAEQKFVAAVLANPKNHRAWFGLGEAQAYQDHLSDALDSYGKAAGLAPGEARYAMRLGQVRLLAGMPPDSAREPLERALALDPSLHEAHFYLGAVHSRSGRATEAARAYTASIRANPRYMDPYIALTKLYLQWQRNELALQVANAGLERVSTPRDEALLAYYVGLIQAKRGDHQAAVEAFTVTLAANLEDATHSDARLMRGLSHAALRNKADARADLDAFLASGLGSTFENDQARRALLTSRAR